jgi:hypothetical protein
MNRNSLTAFLALALLPAPAAASDTCPAVEKFAPGAISTDAYWDWRLTFTPSQTQAYWATSVGWWPATRERSEIHTSERINENDGWGPATTASFSGQYADFDPFVSPDGRTLYFSSMRPVNGAAKLDMDLWKVDRVGTGWGTPQHIALPSIPGYDELYPSIDRAGNLYFARVKAPIPTEDVNIYRSERQADGTFGPAALVPGLVNTAARWEFNPEISPDGRTLVFVRLDLPDALPDEGFGFGDLYVSRLEDGMFGAAKNLGACVNTAGDDFHPTVLWDRNLLYFAKAPGRPSDFYVTPLRLP